LTIAYETTKIAQFEKKLFSYYKFLILHFKRLWFSCNYVFLQEAFLYIATDILAGERIWFCSPPNNWHEWNYVSL